MSTTDVPPTPEERFREVAAILAASFDVGRIAKLLYQITHRVIIISLFQTHTLHFFARRLWDGKETSYPHSEDKIFDPATVSKVKEDRAWAGGKAPAAPGPISRHLKKHWPLLGQITVDTKDLKEIPHYWPQMKILKFPTDNGSPPIRPGTISCAPI